MEVDKPISQARASLNTASQVPTGMKVFVFLTTFVFYCNIKFIQEVSNREVIFPHNLPNID